MKILLLTDMPPCKNYTGGIVLDQLCRFLPKGSLACFAIVAKYHVDARISSDLDWIPIEYYEKPRENWNVYAGNLGALKTSLSLAMETYHGTITKNKLIKNIVKFAQKMDVDLLWCVLQGQTEIRLAMPVSKKLGIPLLTQIWDPPYLFIDDNIPGAISRNMIFRVFEDTLRNCNGFFAASWAMAEQYHKTYGVRAVPFLPSLDSRLAMSPGKSIHDNSDFVIGGAGKVYPVEVWDALFNALDAINWKIGNRNIKIRMFTRDVNIHRKGKMHFEFLGWRSQEETVKLLSDADVLYCPYWFDPYYETVTRLSFPGKLSTFLAAGRPVLFHGPVDASPAKFLKENDAGVMCHSLEPSAIIHCLSQLAFDNELYTTIAENGRRAFDKYLTLESLRKNFADFLQIKEDFLNKL